MRRLAALLANPEVELVVVASPNPFHKQQVIQALEAGKHVLCEKPFGLTTSDVDSMIAAGRVLQPFQQRRYEPVRLFFDTGWECNFLSYHESPLFHRNAMQAAGSPDDDHSSRTLVGDG